MCCSWYSITWWNANRNNKIGSQGLLFHVDFFNSPAKIIRGTPIAIDFTGTKIFLLGSNHNEYLGILYSSFSHFTFHTAWNLIKEMSIFLVIKNEVQYSLKSIPSTNTSTTMKKGRDYPKRHNYRMCFPPSPSSTQLDSLVQGVHRQDCSSKRIKPLLCLLTGNNLPWEQCS